MNGFDDFRLRDRFAAADDAAIARVFFNGLRPLLWLSFPQSGEWRDGAD